MTPNGETGPVTVVLATVTEDSPDARNSASSGQAGSLGTPASLGPTIPLIEQLRRKLLDKNLSIESRVEVVEQLGRLARSDWKVEQLLLYTAMRSGERMVAAAAEQVVDESAVPDPFVWRVLVSQLRHMDAKVRLRVAQRLGEAAIFNASARWHLILIKGRARQGIDPVPGFYDAICAMRKKVASDPAARAAMLNLLTDSCKTARAKLDRMIAAHAIYDAARDHEETWRPLVSVLMTADRATAWAAAESLSNAVATSEYVRNSLREAQKHPWGEQRQELATWALEEPLWLRLEPDDDLARGKPQPKPMPTDQLPPAHIRLDRAKRNKCKRRPAENEKALLALLDTLLEWQEDTISSRRIADDPGLRASRKRSGLIAEVSVATVINHLTAIAALCNVNAMFEQEPKRQFSRFLPGIKHRLRHIVRPLLLDRIRRAEGRS